MKSSKRRSDCVRHRRREMTKKRKRLPTRMQQHPHQPRLNKGSSRKARQSVQWRKRRPQNTHRRLHSPHHHQHQHQHSHSHKHSQHGSRHSRARHQRHTSSLLLHSNISLSLFQHRPQCLPLRHQPPLSSSTRNPALHSHSSLSLARLAPQHHPSPPFHPPPLPCRSLLRQRLTHRLQLQ